MRRPKYLTAGLLVVGVAVLLLSLLVGGDTGLCVMVGVLGFSGLTLVYSLVSQFRNAVTKPAHRLYAKDFSLKFVATLMGLFLVVGTLLYLHVFHTIVDDSLKTVGTAQEHVVEVSNAEYLLRSLICSLDLFMLDVDSNILDRLDGHGILKGWLAIQAVLSFACTVAMLVGLVYSRLHAYFRLNYMTRISNSRNHLYLFFGNNSATELLISDIKKNDPKAIAIIIDLANVKEDDNDEWSGIIGLIAHKHRVFKMADKLGAHVAIASQQLDDIDEDIANRPDFDAFGYLGLPRIKAFIKRLMTTARPQLHIFFMGEDEDLNIRNIITLAKDTTIAGVAADKSLFHRIYCHARYNGPNRVIQDVALKKHLDIKLVDSSHISVELLKCDSRFHPVNVVKMNSENLATVDTALKVLIIGFGEVGRDAFRFLYEFGAFVDSRDVDRRSTFECVIVDRNLDNLKGAFVASMPAIFDDKYKIDSNVNVVFEPVDYNSERFNNVVLSEKFAGEVNYVVISTGNNDEGIALATRIFNKVRRFREDVSNLRIFVRCTDDKKVEVVQKIADHYNQGYGAGDRNEPVIHVFGQPSRTYTYDLVVSDRLIEEGKVFHEKYRALSGDGLSWDDRHRKFTETGTPNIESLRKLRRQESQDQANALHAGTKLIVLRRAMEELAAGEGSEVDWYKFYLEYFNTDGSANVEGEKCGIRYPGLSAAENSIITNLAMLEHLRWNAAHALMGYVFNGDDNGCDERSMRHNCLCEWSRLDEQSEKVTGWVCDYKKYDFCVVDTTIALGKDKLMKRHET